MIANFLADAAGEAPNIINTSAITAVCMMVTGVVGWFMRGRQSRSVKIEGTPGVNVKNETLGVRLHEAWVTRQEFLDFKSEIKADVREMRGTFEKLATIIDERDRKLTEMIEKVASGAYEGRRRLHEQVNNHGQQLAVLAAKTDISKGLGSLGAAIKQAIKPETKS